MASSKVLSRLSSRLQPLSLRLGKPALSPSPLHSQGPSSSRRISRAISRLPTELSCVASMMPLHSAIASARLRSSLAMESQSWGIVPQGISMPL
ncbi:protein NUCLEAR FUSION DEFECTIVE 6, chloroplastic/mitochondrial-like [Punica granatum]|uniref:Protein NUCLEAR FUSION DEFECTIVE 6, chloroplastic/mitochondrial-like n=2 Tax=Punica granatum TaxID=22663 RepID=A0A6P8CZ54_PUNGR|nr:protein NUCLEAR FUSION DEFECTIVE 6, chloroplastic/mitochondrial-like [Punica granatum]PKI76283.1 hypothetical protein CRG98_003394 [Punica granatum]